MAGGTIGMSDARGRRLIAAVAAAYVAVAVATKLAAPAAGWSARDASHYHFPVIDYFIVHGFDRGYPPVLAMLPGMHAYTAVVARALGFGPLDYAGWPAFLIQAPWALAFLALLLGVWAAVPAAPRDKPLALLPLFASSYPLASWLFPTTDIGAFACYLAMLLLLLRGDPLSWRFALAYALLVVLATLFRQNYAVLAIVPALCVAARQARPLLAGDGASWSMILRRGWALLPPLAAAAAMIAGILALWHGFVPPELARHGSGGHIELVPPAHMLALTGLLCWPMALPFARRLHAPGWLVPALAGAALLGALCAVALPLTLDDAGRNGSLVWTIPPRLHLGHALTQLAVGGEIAVGAFVWAGAVATAVRARTAYPELVMFAAFMLSFLAQGVAWQRYVEFPVFLTLGLVLVRGAVPERLDRILVGGWFAAYLLLSIAKPFLGAGAQ